jgi:putative salt-induced outer membrane protein
MYLTALAHPVSLDEQAANHTTHSAVKWETTLKRYLLAAAALIATPALAQEHAETPAMAKALIDSAAKSGEAAQVTAVAAAAKDVFPDYAGAIEAYAASIAASLAPPAPPPPPAPEAPKNPAGAAGLGAWTGNAAASAVVANGNSETLALGLLFKARNEGERLAHNVDGFIDIGRSSGVQNLKRWGLAYQLDYKFSERTYGFGRLSFEEDQFSGYDYRLFAGAGLGHFLAKSEEFSWRIEGGPGYQYSPIDDTREIEKEFAAYAGTDLEWRLREGVTFTQVGKVTWTDPTTTFLSISSLNTALSSKLTAGLAFEWRHETHPPLGREKTDTILRATLGYGF